MARVGRTRCSRRPSSPTRTSTWRRHRAGATRPRGVGDPGQVLATARRSPTATGRAGSRHGPRGPTSWAPSTAAAAGRRAWRVGGVPAAPRPRGPRRRRSAPTRTAPSCSPTFRNSRAAGTPCRRSAGRFVRVAVPYEGTTLPGYLLRPDASGAPRPTFVMTNGSDGPLAVPVGHRSREALDRGWNAFVYDGPGQQSMLFERNVPFRPDWETVLTPVVDALVDRPDVDARPRSPPTASARPATGSRGRWRSSTASSPPAPIPAWSTSPPRGSPIFRRRWWTCSTTARSSSSTRS